MLQQLIEQYGYWALFIGTFLEGETILVLAGLAAHRGYLELHWVILVAFVGSMFGDQFFFYLGRIKGRPFIERRPAWAGRIERVRTMLERHQTLIVLGFRFLYGVRTVTPLFIGSTGYDPKRFAILNAAGAALWAAVVGVGAYLLGHGVEKVLSEAKRYELIMLGVVVLIGLGLWVWRYIVGRRLARQKALEAPAQASEPRSSNGAAA